MVFKMGICDDEYIFRQKFKKYCEAAIPSKLCDFTLIEFSCGEDLISSKEELDLLFLDIEMGRTSGIEVKKYFEDKGINTRIVFLTSHSEMMKQAFGKNIYGFVDKTNYETELLGIIKKVVFEIQNNERWMVESDNQKVSIKISDILYIMADRIYINIVTEGAKYYKRETLKECESLFSERGFYRIHKSCMINFKYLKNVTEKDVAMINGTKLKISRGTCRKIKNQYAEYVRKRI